MGEEPKKEIQEEESDFPEKYILQYIIKRTKKAQPTWQDMNELNHAKEKMLMEIFESGDGEDYFLKTLERVRLNHEKIGVMVSFVNPEYPDMVAIGYSLVNKKAGDKFDHQITHLGLSMGPVGYFKAEGFGKHIAFGRAEEWSTPEALPERTYTIPPSIKKQFHAFVLRSQRYYKDKTLPGWVANFMAQY